MVGREGFEPSKAKPTGLQPVPFGRSGTDPWTGHNCTGQGQLCDLVPAGSESAESTAMP